MKPSFSAYPFGSPMPNRSFSANSYRYGFNGKENDNETGTQDYGLRIYNPALGKFLSVDPLFRSYAWNSSYAFAENDVIRSIDLDGGEKFIQVQIQATKKSAIVFKTVAWKDCYPGQDHGPMGTGTYVKRIEGNVSTRQYYPSLGDRKNMLLGKRLDDETAAKNTSSTKSGSGTGSSSDAVPKVDGYDPFEGSVNPNLTPDGGKPTYDESTNTSNGGLVRQDQEGPIIKRDKDGFTLVPDANGNVDKTVDNYNIYKKVNDTVEIFNTSGMKHITDKKSAEYKEAVIDIKAKESKSKQTSKPSF